MDPERTASSPNVNLDGCFLVDSLRNNDDVIETSDVLPMKLMSITWSHCHNSLVSGDESQRKLKNRWRSNINIKNICQLLEKGITEWYGRNEEPIQKRVYIN